RVRLVTEFGVIGLSARIAARALLSEPCRSHRIKLVNLSREVVVRPCPGVKRLRFLVGCSAALAAAAFAAISCLAVETAGSNSSAVGSVLVLPVACDFAVGEVGV